MDKNKRIRLQRMIGQLTTHLANVIENPSFEAIKIFPGLPGLIYYYPDTNSSTKYSEKAQWDNTKDTFEWLKDHISKACEHNSLVKICHLKDGGIRLRFPEVTRAEKENGRAMLRAALLDMVLAEAQGTKTESMPEDVTNCTSYEKVTVNKENKKMNDFSLSNLKDALISKVTHLDKKTITIIALIALILLVVGKYQDIKDILIGIKDKVKRSKNFKAMVADGTAALSSLKKIVGIKDNEKDNESEA